MFFLKKLYFTKSIYPSFYQNLEDAQKEESAVLFTEVVDGLLTIMVIINFKVIIFRKRIDSPLLMENFKFSKEIDAPTNDLFSLIISTKHNATKVKNHHFIEMFSERLNKIKILYQISAEQQHNIWNEIFSLNPEFFATGGEINLPVGADNKWVD
jgi:hypothetical protein